MEEKCNGGQGDCREISCKNHIFHKIGKWHQVWESPAKEFDFCMKNISREYTFEEISQCFGVSRQNIWIQCYKGMRSVFGRAWKDPDMKVYLRRFDGKGFKMHVRRGIGEADIPRKIEKRLNWDFGRAIH